MTRDDQLMKRSRGVALVTGASTGIGRAIGTRLVEDGFEVYGTSRKVETSGSLRQSSKAWRFSSRPGVFSARCADHYL